MDLDLNLLVAVEADLRLLQDRITAFRELVRANPQYQGDWRRHPQWWKARRQLRSFHSKAKEAFSKPRS